jgi:hypothetical protein
MTEEFYHIKKDGSKEKIEVQETSRITGPNSYNDNWDLVNYTYPIYQSYPETEIKDSEETVQTPFENESIFLSGETRKEQRRKRELRDSHKRGVKRYTSKRLHQPDDEDPDIQREIDRYGSDNVRIIQ